MLIRCPRCSEQLEGTARFCGVCGTTLPAPEVGRVIASRYALYERIGAGSLGIVYRAEQLGTGRKVAIKMLPPDTKRDPYIVERFRREGDLLCKLRSPHTVTTYEADREPDGSLYIVMELSTGKSLAEVIRHDGALDWVRVLRILAGICDSLAEAHALGVVHRDLKPENILLESRAAQRDFVKVLDFGLAKLLNAQVHLSPAGVTIGAIEYASPEQLLQRPIDARSDLYSLGVLAYLLVTGRHPLHEARTYGDLVAAHIQITPPPPSKVKPELPADFDTILARLLDKDPDRRFPDATALAAVIGVALSTLAPGGDTIQEPSLGEEATELGEPPKRP